MKGRRMEEIKEERNKAGLKKRNENTIKKFEKEKKKMKRMEVKGERRMKRYLDKFFSQKNARKEEGEDGKERGNRFKKEVEDDWDDVSRVDDLVHDLNNYNNNNNNNNTTKNKKDRKYTSVVSFEDDDDDNNDDDDDDDDYKNNNNNDDDDDDVSTTTTQQCSCSNKRSILNIGNCESREEEGKKAYNFNKNTIYLDVRGGGVGGWEGGRVGGWEGGKVGGWEGGRVGRWEGERESGKVERRMEGWRRESAKYGYGVEKGKHGKG